MSNLSKSCMAPEDIRCYDPKKDGLNEVAIQVRYERLRAAESADVALDFCWSLLGEVLSYLVDGTQTLEQWAGVYLAGNPDINCVVVAGGRVKAYETRPAKAELARLGLETGNRHFVIGREPIVDSQVFEQPGTVEEEKTPRR